MSRLLTKLLPTNLQGTSKAALKIRDHIPLMIALKTTIAKQLKTLMRIVIATEKHRMIALMTTIAKQLKTLMRTAIATEKQRRMSGLLTKLLATNLQGTSKAGLKIRGRIPLSGLLIKMLSTSEKQR